MSDLGQLRCIPSIDGGPNPSKETGESRSTAVGASVAVETLLFGKLVAVNIWRSSVATEYACLSRASLSARRYNRPSLERRIQTRESCGVESSPIAEQLACNRSSERQTVCNKCRVNVVWAASTSESAATWPFDVRPGTVDRTGYGRVTQLAPCRALDAEESSQLSPEANIRSKIDLLLAKHPRCYPELWPLRVHYNCTPTDAEMAFQEHPIAYASPGRFCGFDSARQLQLTESLPLLKTGSQKNVAYAGHAR